VLPGAIAAKVTVQGTHEMVDDYGNKSTIPVVNVTYLRDTLSKSTSMACNPATSGAYATAGPSTPTFSPDSWGCPVSRQESLVSLTV
jgi:hypothetical protein